MMWPAKSAAVASYIPIAFTLALFALLPLDSVAQVLAQAGSQQRSEYRIEIIVLRHLNNEARSFEAPSPPPLPTPDSDSGLEQEAAEPVNRIRWRGLPWREFQLKNENSRIKRSRDFRPLLHLGWTQEALNTDEAGWVPVRGTAEDGTAIAGRARLTVNRYLHLRLELDADIPDKGEFQLRQSRRMRSGELHYFDHPEFGALIEIIPEPEPEPEPELEPAATTGAEPGTRP